MKSITVLKEKGEKMLFHVSGCGEYFAMRVSDLVFLSDISFEWFEEYFPNCPEQPYSIYLMQDGSVRDEEAHFKSTFAE